MTLNPFVYGTTSDPECFDEDSPCLLEQKSMCVIDVAKKADGATNILAGQSTYVPWLICMDSKGDPSTACDTQVGVDRSKVEDCLSSDVRQLLKNYIKVDEPISSTPTVHVNGKKVRTSFKAIQSALCRADPTLKGCSVTPLENRSWSADWEPSLSHLPAVPIVTV